MLSHRRTQDHSPTRAEVDPAQLVSNANNAAQTFLLEGLVGARVQRGLSTQDVAEILQADNSMIEDMETGDYEPNLSELRAYSWAVDAVIEYRVHALAASSLVALHDRALWASQNEDVWVSADNWEWSDDVTRDELLGSYKANTKEILL